MMVKAGHFADCCATVVRMKLSVCFVFVCAYIHVSSRKCLSWLHLNGSDQSVNQQCDVKNYLSVFAVERNERDVEITAT